jgi:hypothetical protein
LHEVAEPTGAGAVRWAILGLIVVRKVLESLSETNLTFSSVGGVRAVLSYPLGIARLRKLIRTWFNAVESVKDSESSSG